MNKQSLITTHPLIATRNARMPRPFKASQLKVSELKAAQLKAAQHA